MTTILVLNQDPTSLSEADRKWFSPAAKLVRFDCQDSAEEMDALIKRIRELKKTEDVALVSREYFDPTVIVFELGIAAKFEKLPSSSYIIYLR